MIPYFVAPPLHLGPVPIQPFGVLSATGVWLGSSLLVRHARRAGLDPGSVERLALWALLGGLVGAHLVHILFYHPEELRENGPLQLLKVWDGLSSTGGVLGGLVACIWYLRHRGLRFAPYADAFALALPAGWAIARLGCFAVHDHPGSLTHFFLAVDFPGGPRHDLGLYDAIVLASITAIVYALRHRAELQGRLLGVVALLYGACRFCLDFLRARDVSYADARYLGLTPAQYAAIALVVYGVWVIAPALRRSRLAGGPS